MINPRQNRAQIGFTLVEMMVSLALFTIVSTITVGALLSLIGSNQRLVKQQTLTSSAIASLDNMTREIRTGNYYFCGDSTAQSGSKVTNDCLVSGSKSFSFVETSARASSGGRVAYIFKNNSLYRTIGSGGTEEKLLSDDVLIDVPASNFYVTGTGTLTSGTNTQQPTVTVIMVLQETAEIELTTLQTTVTQRSLDI